MMLRMQSVAELPDEDIAALRGIGTAWRRPIGL